MFCSKCGKQVAADSAFCRYCGASLAEDAPPASGAVTAQPKDSAESRRTVLLANAGGPGSGGATLPSNVESLAAAASAGRRPRDRPGQKDIYAGFWKRLAAALVDGVLVSIVVILIDVGVALLIGVGDGAGGTSAAIGIAGLVGVVFGILYYPVLESSPAQATWGKRALGIRVTDLSGRRISFWRAFGRYFAKLISALTLFFGYLMAAFTDRKQALHDLIAGTLVVNAP